MLRPVRGHATLQGQAGDQLSPLVAEIAISYSTDT
jgi:hypothetical protein